MIKYEKGALLLSVRNKINEKLQENKKGKSSLYKEDFPFYYCLFLLLFYD